MARLYGLLRPHLDERQRRLLLGAEARALGHGGIRLVARAAGVQPGTVGRGVAGAGRRAGAAGPGAPAGRGPQAAGGPDPGLVPALLALVEPESGAIRSRRCGGRPSRPGSWRRS